MTEKAVANKAETLPDLDDLLQCPVCYEIPAGQIFQCNEGHHVCGRCKLRLDVCPVCRAFFFGTRNYAMEELIANIRKLRAFKLGGKVTTGSTTPEQQSEAKESTSEENDSENDELEELSAGSINPIFVDAPRACSGLFRCLCCKTNPERLPSGRLLNHLRYYHSPDLIEGRCDETGEYVQAWQFSTDVGRIVTAVRVGEMGLFFLVIEITHNAVISWLVMAASPRVAEEFCYTYTLSGNDREAIFSDVVWSVRTCEGYLKKQLRCLSVTGADARALLAPSTMSAKLRLRRTPLDAEPHLTQPRAVLRVANRSERAVATPTAPPTAPAPDAPEELEPFLQDLQNDVARLSRAFATLGREANALVRSEAEMRARLETHRQVLPADSPPAPAPAVSPPHEAEEPQPAPEPAPLSRNARRRMRQRLRQALLQSQTMDDDVLPNAADAAAPVATVAAGQTNGRASNSLQNNNSRVRNDQIMAADRAHNHAGGQNVNTGDRANNNQHKENTARANRASPQHSPAHAVFSGFAVVQPGPVAPPPVPPPVAGAAGTSSNGAAGTSSNGAAGTASNGTGGRNKKKRRQRR